MGKTYLFRAKLEFDWGFQEADIEKPPTPPVKLPVQLGPFRLDRSPNYGLYLEECGWSGPLNEKENITSHEYPISILYVEVKVTVPKGNSPIVVADDMFEQLEAMFRLFQKGDLFLRRHLGQGWEVKDDRPQLVFFLMAEPAKPDPNALYCRGPYRLDDEILQGFTAFFNRYWDIIHTKHQPIYNALWRFNANFERSSAAARLLELVIALEALFGDSSDSLAYKVALRCSSFLYPPSEERMKVFQQIKRVYGDRSKIVHGDRLEVNYTQEEMDYLENIVRISICKFLEHYKKGNSINSPERLDEMLFFGKA